MHGGNPTVTAYSHGLEKIYSIETINVNTIRPLQTAQKVQDVEEQSVEELPLVQAAVQEDLPLGPEYVEFLRSYVLEEPLSVLGLTPPAATSLKESPFSTIQHLLDTDLKSLGKNYKVGQGHIDEITSKLKEYCKRRILYPSKKVDFMALLRSSVKGLDPVKLVVLGEKYGLGEVFPLSASQRAEANRLSPYERTRWQQLCLEELQSEKYLVPIQQKICEVVGVFLKQWMRLRCGLASEEELLERLERVSSDQQVAKKLLMMFADILGEEVVHAPFLYKVESGVYSVDNFTLQDFNHAHKILKGFFYQESIHYTLSDLLALISREEAKKWKGYPDGFLVRVATLSASFTLFKKSQRGKLCIAKSFLP